MAQQLNLLDARFSPQSLRGSARHGLWVLAAVLLAAWATSQGLRWATERTLAAAAEVETAVAPLRAQMTARTASAPASADTELARLKALEASQRRIGAALESGLAGRREGHAEYLMALARQASDRLWITGFAMSDDGRAIDLEGRMSDASALASYLRQLNAEPRFKGRPFAQLNLKSVDANGVALPYTEFLLRSTNPATNTDPTP